MNGYHIIGGADGPTSVFLAGKVGVGLFHAGGLVMVVLLLIPNIIYAVRFRGQENKCTSKGLMVLEQIGRYASMFFMIFNIGSLGSAYSSVNAYFTCWLGNIALIIAYWLAWMLYFSKRGFGTAMALAILPVCIFLLNGAALMQIPLIISSIVFGVAHIYITYQNAKK